MCHDAPAATPLIAYILGLLSGHSWREAAGFFMVAMLFAALRRARVAIAFVALAAGAAVSVGDQQSDCRDTAIARALMTDRFVVADAPIDRDWMQRETLWTLRVERVRVNGNELARPLTLMARFVPPPVGMYSRVIAEGFLRVNERGELTVSIKSPRLLRYTGKLDWRSPATWNRALANRIRLFAGAYPEEVALAEALALGRGERLAAHVRDNYKRAGTYHLLVFSGLQIALAAAALAALLRWMRAPRVSDWSLLGFATLAPLFIGPSASVSRAAVAIGVYAVSRLMHRPTTPENLWCVAALARLVIAPDDLSQPGFQLSYGGAGALLFIGKPLASRVWRWPVYAASVESVVTPLTLFHFHQYALGGSLTTLFLTPVISVMLVISALACAWPGTVTLHTLRLIHRAALYINDVASIGAGVFSAPPALAIGGALAWCLVAIAILRGRRRAAALLGCMAFAIAGAVLVSRRSVEDPTLTMLDVGQGDALVVRAGRRTVLVDGGPSAARLIPLLVDRGIRSLDVVVLTHVHPDHCGALPHLIGRMRVGEMWISPRRFIGECAHAVMQSAAARGVPIHLIRDGDRIRLTDAVALTALDAGVTFRRAPENNASVVLLLRSGARTALLTGDIERDAERIIAARSGPVDVLKVAHHGSRTSSTPPLLEAVQPRVALVSCGRHNLFGHPHPEVLHALRTRRATVWRTDRSGSIDVIFGRDALSVTHEIDTPR